MRFGKRPGNWQMTELLQSGEPAPDFELSDIRGKFIRLSDYRGRTVVLAFLRGFL